MLSISKIGKFNILFHFAKFGFKSVFQLNFSSTTHFQKQEQIHKTPITSAQKNLSEGLGVRQGRKKRSYHSDSIPNAIIQTELFNFNIITQIQFLLTQISAQWILPISSCTVTHLCKDKTLAKVSIFFFFLA